MKTLRACYEILRDIMGNSIEEYESVELVEHYRQHWKPSKTRVILLAESHVFTSDTDRLIPIPRLNALPGYPTQYAKFVYCLGYGEKQLTRSATHPKHDGTPQFWKIFYSCDNHVQSTADFAPILKKTDSKQRLSNKIELLLRLRDKGIWLVDASVAALYNNGTKPSFRIISSVIRKSWEHYTKDVVLNADPQHIICIGRTVAGILSDDIKKLKVPFTVLDAPGAYLSSEKHTKNLRQYISICCGDMKAKKSGSDLRMGGHTITKPFQNCYWVIPGKFLAGEYPGSLNENDVKKRIQSLTCCGITHIVDLTGAADNLERYHHLLARENGVSYSQLSLPDYSVPSSKDDTIRVLNTIDKALQTGKTVYLHCWGGIGRTGMIVGCWFARHGRRGRSALIHLKHRWMDFAKSVYKNTPETKEQESYILNWSEASPDIQQSKYLGSMMGLAVGDALGTTVEFSPPGTFEAVTDIVGGGPFNLKKGQWTDDTSMALCLADSLLKCGGFDAYDQMSRYLRWREHGYLSSTGTCFDIGGTTAEAISFFKHTGTAYAGPSNPNAAGNGSLMRLAPVPLFYAFDPKRAILMSAESSRTTHGARTCIDACRYFAALITGAIQGASKEELLSPRYSPVPGIWEKEPLCSEIDEIACGSFKAKSPPDIIGSGYVVKSLEAALWAFYTSGNFRDGCLSAVNLGNDADTTGAIYGQLAGAFYGIDGIPSDWWQCLAHMELIHTFALGLYGRAFGEARTE